MPKGSILVIDDEAEIREGLELLLKTEGYQVTMADTGQSGLARLGEQPYDLLLLDVSLPDRNGIELLKDIRRQNPNLPIVLITAYGSIEMARAASRVARWTTSPSPGPTMNCWRRWRRQSNRIACARRMFSSSGR